jgi:hypothetical protein
MGGETAAHLLYGLERQTSCGSWLLRNNGGPPTVVSKIFTHVSSWVLLAPGF